MLPQLLPLEEPEGLGWEAATLAQEEPEPAESGAQGFPG